MRNCQWSIDLMDAAMVIGNKYTLRDSSTAMLNELIRGRAEAGPSEDPFLFWAARTHLLEGQIEKGSIWGVSRVEGILTLLNECTSRRSANL
jgi:hypothetical protein